MRACPRETLSLDVLRQAVRMQEFSNGAVKNCLCATPPSIRAQDYVFIRHLAELSPQKANVGSMPPALKICGWALIPHSFSLNVSPTIALPFIQQWEAAVPPKNLTTATLGRILPPPISSWPQWSGILAIIGHISSTLEHLPSQAGSVQAAQPDTC